MVVHSPHTGQQGTHLAGTLADIKVRLDSTKPQWIPLSTADPLITPDEMFAIRRQSCKQQKKHYRCVFIVFGCLELVCERSSS